MRWLLRLASLCVRGVIEVRNKKRAEWERTRKVPTLSLNSKILINVQLTYVDDEKWGRPLICEERLKAWQECKHGFGDVI
jgi:hypothetical protein